MSASIEQLEAFVETVQQGSFKKASLRIGKHITTISGLVASLEAELSLTLFLRKPRSLELTEEGQAILRFAEAVLRENEHLESKAFGLQQGAPARLSLAIDSSLRSPELSALFHRLMERFPGVELRLLCGDPMQVRHWLLSGQADIGFAMRVFTRHHELAQARSYSFELAAIASPELGLGQRYIERDQLRGLQQVIPNFMQESGLAEASRLSNRLMYCNDLYEMVSLVETGPVWGYLPAFICRTSLKQHKIEQIYLSETEQNRANRWETEVVWLASRPMNPAMTYFMQQASLLPER